MTAIAKRLVKNERLLRKILWIDAIMGGSTAGIGLLFFSALTHLLGLPTRLIVIISATTLLYAIVAFRLAVQKTISIQLLSILVAANWLWTLVSVLLLLYYADQATALGLVFLVLQILVVGGLAYAEGNQLYAKTGEIPDA